MKSGSAALAAFWRLEWRIRRRDARRLLTSAMSAILVLILALLSVPLVDPAVFTSGVGTGVEAWPLHVVSGYVVVMVLAAAVPLLEGRQLAAKTPRRAQRGRELLRQRRGASTR